MREVGGGSSYGLRGAGRGAGAPKEEFYRGEETPGPRGGAPEEKTPWDTHNSCYEVVMLAVITTSGSWEVL